MNGEEDKFEHPVWVQDGLHDFKGMTEDTKVKITMGWKLYEAPQISDVDIGFFYGQIDVNGDKKKFVSCDCELEDQSGALTVAMQLIKQHISIAGEVSGTAKYKVVEGSKSES